ncbi:hypothetical protein CcaverHIS002_0307150 [Cutaneotrichosporon cavernicola]|nr:hypothetical protein CcaverHIS002_0307150 [Cutaneotrichosporon cavernicola]
MAAISPARARFDYHHAMHPTSSLREPPPNTTPPGLRSPSPSTARSSDDRDDRRKGKGRERDELADDDHPRPEKRSRTGAGSGRSGRHSGDSPSSKGTANSPPRETQPTTKSRPANLAPIKPIGFAASREARGRDDGGDPPVPSPVVLGFDFKSIDEDQLKTVRDTISIKEQQQALIAQRRKEMAASQPSTPRELTFKGWTPKDPEKRGVGARREKTRDKVERMSIVTSTSDKDVVPGSKSAPLNQGLASQQQSPREPPSGSQTAMPQHILPPMHYPAHPHSAHYIADPRTAPLSHSRSGRPEESNFARQQQPYHQSQPPLHRSSGSGLPSASSASRRDMRYPPELGARPSQQQQQQQQLPQQPNTADRRNFSIPALHPGGSHYPPSPHGATHPIGPGPPSAALRNGGVHRPNGYSLSPSPPSHGREQFLAPFNQLYDLLSGVEQQRFQLQEMMHRSEQTYTNQMAAQNEFKATASRASGLLRTLQESADSLKEMVRYEVDRAISSDRREVDELRERVRALEDRLAHK